MNLKWTKEREAFYAARDLNHALDEEERARIMATLSDGARVILDPSYALVLKDRERRRLERIQAEAEGRIVPVKR